MGKIEELVLESVLHLNARALRALQKRQFDKAVSLLNDAILTVQGAEGPIERATAQQDEMQQATYPYFFEDYNDGRLIYSVSVERDATTNFGFGGLPQKAAPPDTDLAFCRGLHGSLNVLCSFYSMENIQNLLLGLLLYNYGLAFLLLASLHSSSTHHHGLAIVAWEESINALSSEMFSCLPVCACLHNLAYVHTHHDALEYTRICYKELELWLQEDQGMLSNYELDMFRQIYTQPRGASAAAA